MPIALDRGNGIGRPGIVLGIGCCPIYDSPEAAGILPPARKLVAAPSPATANSLTSSSSIGNNSDDDEEVAEVQSAYKGPLDAMDALEESLPIRRGISDFYRGKSKSFASLADCSSSKDLAKPENAFTRKRRNLVALKYTWERPHSSPLRGTAGGISKRHLNPSRSTLALAVAMCHSRSSSSEEEEEEENHHWLLPPLHQTGKPVNDSDSVHMRSFSMMDLRGMSTRYPKGHS